jgi:hypothetical protein
MIYQSARHHNPEDVATTARTSKFDFTQIVSVVTL